MRRDEAYLLDILIAARKAAELQSHYPDWLAGPALWQPIPPEGHAEG